MKHLFLIIISLLFSFQLIGQSNVITDEVVGEWTTGNNEANILKINQDKSFELHTAQSATVVSGHWTVMQDELLIGYRISGESDSTIAVIERYAIQVAANDKVQLQNIADDTIIYLPKVSTTNAHQLPSKDELAELDFSLTSILRGFLGMFVLLLIAFVFSSDRKAIKWRTVGIGLGIQILLAFGILKVAFIAKFFELIGKIFVVILDFTKAGSEFLLGGLLNTETYGYIFAFQVLPTIIFFSALTSLLFYLGVIQKVVYALAWLMTKALKLSGAESLSVAGNIFLGQTESPLLIKAYLERMNRSEILLVMSGGMATLAGGVLAAYIAFLGGDDPVQRLYFAKHLLAASIMAAPGVIVISKIIVPQTEEINNEVEVSKEKIGSNVLDAISNGTSEGLKLAVNVAAMLLTFIAFIAMTNFILMKIGGWTNLNQIILEATNQQYDGLNLQFLLGHLFAPIVWIMGVVSEDMTLVGRLIGEKLIMTEFIAYVSLAELKESLAFTSQKSILMATYALCGFANFASIGIQIGGIGSLAPGKRKLLSQYGLRALLAGSLASLLSATIVGMILG